MSKLDIAITDLNKFNALIDQKKIRYAVGKDKMGRKVTIQTAPDKTLQVTFNELIKHLGSLAKKEKNGTKDIDKTLKGLTDLYKTGRRSLFESKKKMNFCQKMILALRQFFGNLGRPSHYHQLQLFLKTHLPCEKMNRATEECLTQVIKELQHPQAHQFWFKFKQFILDLLTDESKSDAEINKFFNDEQTETSVKPFETAVNFIKGKEEIAQKRALINSLIKEHDGMVFAIFQSIEDSQPELAGMLTRDWLLLSETANQARKLINKSVGL